jgi:hypothetical protein
LVLAGTAVAQFGDGSFDPMAAMMGGSAPAAASGLSTAAFDPMAMMGSQPAETATPIWGVCMN